MPTKLNGACALRSRFLALPLLLTPAAAIAQAEDPARNTVQALDDGLIAIMKSGKAAGVAGRSAMIGPIVDRTFDLPLMMRLVVGPTWNTIAPAEQAALVAAFRKMTVGQYARNFDSWSGESFVIAPQVEERAGDKLVRTTLRGSGEPVSISYRLRQSGGRWKIIDIFYKNAISQLATRRADFSGILASGGPKALIAHLDQLATKSGD
ncbi:MAG: ABC transporter substrate-binding protein [Sphingomonas sp.]|nr:ABC transporter substrate-binding protein [Sphingomonas sp.]